MHIELTPKVSPQEGTRAILAIAADIRAVVAGDAAGQLDLGCRLSAAGLGLAYAGTMIEGNAAVACPGPFPCGEEAAAVLESCCKEGDGQKAFDWRIVIQIIIAVLQGILPKPA